MRDLLYDQMEDAGIAIKCILKYINDKGEKVTKDDAFHLPVDLELKHAEYLLHADETGFDINS